MKAMIHKTYGIESLKLTETDRPEESDDELLIKVHAAALNPADNFFLNGRPYLMRPMTGFLRPRQTIPGRDMAGVVESVGSNVEGFSPGDRVFGEVSKTCAEFIAVKPKTVALMPSNLDFTEAAAVPLAGITALQGLRDTSKLEAGQHILINGASGGVGTNAIQVAKNLGAEVTGVCSGRNTELVRSLGADHVVNYETEDFADRAEAFDVMFDTVGNRSLKDCKRALKPKGSYVAVGAAGGGPIAGPLPRLFGSMGYFAFRSNRGAVVAGKANQEDLAVLRGWIESSKLTPTIDATYPLAELKEAFAHLQTSRVRGKLAIEIA